mmetsp:Transcript_23146/g.39560  ORF Transcript_23146/g.39560 Transcript_23146/m.39560 type:complete len:114 (-) Transcript_23146:11-352(-)
MSLRSDPLVPDPVLDLAPEVLDQPLDRPGRRITQRADRVALDLLGHVQQHIDLLDLCLAAHQPVHHAHHPAGAFAAGGTLAAGLMLIELREPPDRFDDIGAFVHHDDGSGPEA